MLHDYGPEPFDDDGLYRVDGELLNMVFQLCRYFGQSNRDTHSVVNFVLSNLMQIRDHGGEPELNEEDFRAELKRLGVIVPRRS